MLLSDRKGLYREACAADAAWMAEIKKAFPRLRAGDVRYTCKAHGEEGTALRAAYDNFRLALDAWHAGTGDSL